jgi:hypothetical protein
MFRAHSSNADAKALARDTIRNLRDENFNAWFAELGPYQAMKLQEEHAKQLAPVVVNGEGTIVPDVPVVQPEEPPSEKVDEDEYTALTTLAPPPPAAVPEGVVRLEDGSVRRMKIPEKDLRAKAIVYLSRLQRYLEDLPPRQIVPAKSRAVGMSQYCTPGDVYGEVGTLSCVTRASCG